MMKLRKSIPGTFILIIYACLFLTMAAATIYHVIHHYDVTGDFELHSMIAFLFSIIIILISAFVPGHNKIIEILLITSLISVLFVIRLQAIWSTELASIDQSMIQSIMISSDKGSLLPAQANSDFLYQEFLRILFLFFGNKIYPVLIVQSLVQCVSLLLLTVSVRKTAGVAPALLTLSAFGFQPELLVSVTRLTPDVLVFFFVSAGIYAVFSILVSKSIFRSVFSGLLIALVCFIDRFGVVLIAISILFLISSHTRRFHKNEETIQPVRMFIRILLLFAAIALGLTGLFFIRVQSLNVEILNQFENLFQMYLNGFIPEAGEFFQNMALAYLQIPSVSRIIMILPALFVIVGYWKVKYDTVYAAIVLFIATHLYAGILQEPFWNMPVLLFVWIGISAVGVCQLFMILPLKQAAKEDAEKKDTEKDLLSDKKVEFIEENKTEELIIKELNITEDLSKADQTGNTSNNYLHNPLPVPPKHVKKTMDYSFEPDDAMMHYDVELKSDQTEYDLS